MAISGTLLVADDVRIETAGKLIPVGMYTNDILIRINPFFVAQIAVIYAIEEDVTVRHPTISFETTFPGEEPKITNVPLTWPPLPPEGIPFDRTRWSLKYAIYLGPTTMKPGPIQGAVIYGEQKTQLTPHWIRYEAPETEVPKS